MQCPAPSVSIRAENVENALTLSPLLVFRECDVAVLLNMLVTLARSLSNELLLVGLPLPLSLAICGGIFGRSDGDIVSGSSVYGLGRMCDRPDSPLVFGRGRSDVFDGFWRRGVTVLADC